MFRTPTALVAVALCALPLAALTACSSSSPSASSSSSSGSKSSGSSSGASATIARPSDPCTLLSAQEEASVMGTTAGNTYSASGSCGYGDGTSIQLTLSPANIDWATAISIAKVQYSTLTTVSGLGDQAVEAPNFIEVRKSNIIFDIDDPDGDGNTSSKYQALAKIVLSHLG